MCAAGRRRRFCVVDRLAAATAVAGLEPHDPASRFCQTHQLTRARLYNGEAEPPDGIATMKGERCSNVSWIEPIGDNGGRQSPSVH